MHLQRTANEARTAAAKPAVAPDVKEQPPARGARTSPTGQSPFGAAGPAVRLTGPVQAEAVPGPAPYKETGAEPAAAAIHQAAQAGVQTSAGRLPHAEQIQHSFGRHDVSQIQAHLGPVAAGSARAMHAVAYATGNHVVFAGTPDLHTAAHEAAHVVQQRSGVHLAGGVGAVGDVYERHADAVANTVAAGRSAEGLLDRFAGPAPGGGGPQGAPVQRLIGFEIEAQNIPVTTSGANPMGAVKNFLAGGLQYAGIPSGKPTWDRVTDHGLIGKAISAERAKWAAAAAKNPAELAAPAHRAGHVEYATVPFRETEKATAAPWFGGAFGGRTIYGTNQMAATMNEIQNDIAALAAYTANAKVVGNLQIGIPDLNGWKQAANHYGIANPDVFAQNSRANIVAEMNNERLYVQATLGVLPEKITSFMAEAAKGAPHNPVPLSAEDARALAKPTGTLMNKLMTQVTATVPGLVANFTGGGGPLPTNVATEGDALAGYLTLVLQESLGSVVWQVASAQIGGVPKNMVNFLSKTPLHEIPPTLPTRVRTDLLAQNQPVKFNKLVKDVVAKHNAIGGQLHAVNKAITDQHIRGAAGNALLTSPGQWIKEVLSGQKDQFAQSQYVQQGGRLGPEDPARGGRTGIRTADASMWNLWSTGHTRAIPLETRSYGKIIKSAALPGYADEMKKLVIRSH